MIILAIGSKVKADEKNFVYHSITKGVVVTINEKVTSKENEIINFMFSDDGETTQTVLDLNLATRKWESRNKQNTDLVASRNGNIIIVQGRVKGEEITKEIKIDNRPWFQAWRLPLSYFVLSGENKLEFWTIRPDLKECIMVVLREKEETIKINGQAVEAVKVKVTLNNWMSKFWSAHYWFRKSDGVYLRYEGANGPPGTPVTVIELISEVK